MVFVPSNPLNRIWFMSTPLSCRPSQMNFDNAAALCFQPLQLNLKILTSFAEKALHFCTFQNHLCVLFEFFMCIECAVRIFTLLNTFCSPKFIAFPIFRAYDAFLEEKRVEVLQLFTWLMHN